MCTSHKHVEAAAADQKSFTNLMLGQAKTVFGGALGVFNTLTNAYTSIVNAGPSQRGFSPAERSALVSSAVTAGANAARFANAKANAPVGGGNAPSASGIGAGAKAAIAQRSAEATATATNQIEQADWATGRENWGIATKGLQAAPAVFSESSAATFNAGAQKGLDRNEAYAKAADAAQNAWQSEVSGAIGGGLKGFMEGGPAGAVAGAAGGAIGGANPAGAQGPDFSG